MPVFNSLGSNYKLRDVTALFSAFAPQGLEQLKALLADKYDAKAELTYKGREALFLALKQLNLESGSSVAVNGYTCFAVYDAVHRAGFKPIFVDISKKSLNFTAANLKKAIKKNKNIRAVIVQNTLGMPTNIEAIESVCKKHKLPIVEDLAHSIGMYYDDGREAGTVGEVAALSFSQDKVIDAVSGGALIYKGQDVHTDFSRLKYFRLLKDYYYIPNTLMIRSTYSLGLGKLNKFILSKLNMLPRPMDGDADDVRKPDVWHANLALRRFSELDDSLAHRQEIADIYREALPKKLQMTHHGRATYLRFPVQIDNPSGLIAHLKAGQVHVSDTWYESPISPGRCLKDTNYKRGECPNSEYVASRMVNLPTHINVDHETAADIARKVQEWLSMQK